MVPTCSAVKASCTSLMSISFPTNPGNPLAIHFDIRIKIIPGTYLVPPHDRISSNLWTRAVSVYGTSGTGCVSVVRPRAELEYEPSWRSVVNCSCILGLNRERAEKSNKCRRYQNFLRTPSLLLALHILYLRFRLHFLVCHTHFRQACYEAAKAMNAHGAGVQLKRCECFTQACRAVWPGSELLDDDLQQALL